MPAIQTGLLKKRRPAATHPHKTYRKNKNMQAASGKGTPFDYKMLPGHLWVTDLFVRGEVGNTFIFTSCKRHRSSCICETVIQLIPCLSTVLNSRRLAAMDSCSKVVSITTHCPQGILDASLHCFLYQQAAQALLLHNHRQQLTWLITLIRFSLLKLQVPKS